MAILGAAVVPFFFGVGWGQVPGRASFPGLGLPATESGNLARR